MEVMLSPTDTVEFVGVERRVVDTVSPHQGWYLADQEREYRELVNDPPLESASSLLGWDRQD